MYCSGVREKFIYFQFMLSIYSGAILFFFVFFGGGGGGGGFGV